MFLAAIAAPIPTLTVVVILSIVAVFFISDFQNALYLLSLGLIPTALSVYLLCVALLLPTYALCWAVGLRGWVEYGLASSVAYGVALSVVSNYIDQPFSWLIIIPGALLLGVPTGINFSRRMAGA